MASTLPVPIEFSLPAGWRSVPPDAVNTPDAAFVALHTTSSQHGFTANITITGQTHDDAVVLTEIADTAVENLREAGGRDVKRGRRDETGTAEQPGLTQAVKLNVDVQGVPQDLIQFQVFVIMRDRHNPNHQAVLQIVLSSLPEQFPTVIGDFEQFLSTIRPESAP